MIRVVGSWAVLAVAVAVVAAAGAACSSSVPANAGLGEPIQVSGAQFISGPLPGSAPDPDASAAAEPDAGPPVLTPLSVTSVIFTNSTVVSGIGGTSVSGLATSDTVAVGVRLESLGTGYWVVPIQGQDAQFPGQSDFGFSLSFDRGDSPGETNLHVVAIGSSGAAGQEVDAPICIQSRVPDNGHACEPNHKVPQAVFTLTWNVDFDVDLHVITPGGFDVNPKTLVTSQPYDGGLPVPPTLGLIDRDSIGNCVVDGWREEDLVFQDAPPDGNYLVYAAPFASCGQEAVTFTFTIYEPGSDGNLHPTFTRSGELLANDATGGASPGLFVAQKTFD